MFPKVPYIVHAPENQGSSARMPPDTTLSAQKHLNSLPTQAFLSAGCIHVYPFNTYIPCLLNPLILTVYLHSMCSCVPLLLPHRVASCWQNPSLILVAPHIHVSGTADKSVKQKADKFGHIIHFILA